MSGSRESLRQYFQAIDRRFSALRGIPMATSPRDVEQIVSWYEQGVPVTIVIRSLDEMEESHARGSRAAEPIRSLRFARSAVERKFREHRLLAPAAPEAAPATGFSTAWVAGELATLADRLRAPLLEGSAADAVSRAAEEVGSLRGSLPPRMGARAVDDVERALAVVDAELMQALRAASPELAAAARADAETALATFRTLLQARAFEAAATKRADAGLRERLGVPRVTLFGAA